MRHATMLERSMWQGAESSQEPTRNWGSQSNNPLQKLKPAKNDVNLEADPSTVKLSVQTPALANTLIAALRETETEDSAQLCLDSWLK